jgi:sugar phosphate isomerase/epimerase
MKYCISNIALSPFDHAEELQALPSLGITGLEVAPSRRWQETYPGPDNAAVAAYRQEIESAGVQVVGLHSLFFDHQDWGLFKGAETSTQSIAFLEHLSAVCRDLGGKSLIYGGGRKRGSMPMRTAHDEAVDFFGELCRRIKDHGTYFCFEPLGPNDTDFINSAYDSIAIVREIASPALRVQLDAKALYENDEAVQATFDAAAPDLVHFHANEPGLQVLGSSGTVDHATLGKMLAAIGYDGTVTIEQRMLNAENPLSDVAQSAAVLRASYGIGNISE